MTFKYGNFNIVSPEGVTEERVKELIGISEQKTSRETDAKIEKSEGIVLDQVDKKFVDVYEYGYKTGDFDDTKTYDTYEDMIRYEPEGRKDTIYVIKDGSQYIWDVEGTEYIAVRKAITKAEIEEVFK